MMEQGYWCRVDFHGNPEKAGIYDVILIYDETYYSKEDEEYKPTGRKLAVQTKRSFSMARINDGWIMNGQPKEGLVWHEQSGSYYNERVYAWYPQRDFPSIDLPDDVYWDDDV